MRRPMLQTASRCVCLAMLVLSCTLTAQAENWNMWRGPRGDGTSDERAIPTTWSESENIARKVPLPGEGHASPSVWEDRVFVVACLPDTSERVLICLDR